MPTAKLGRYAPTGKLGHSGIEFEAEYPESAVPTPKLGRSDIKIVTVYPDGVELIKVERTIFEK